MKFLWVSSILLPVIQVNSEKTRRKFFWFFFLTVGIFIFDSGELDFSGVKTNIASFRFNGYTTEPKWIVKFEMTSAWGYSQGAHTQLTIVQTPVIDKPWDRDYPNFHHTWTGAGSAVYGDLVEENFDRTSFKVGRLIVDGKSVVSGEKLTVTWKFDMTSSYNYSLVILGESSLEQLKKERFKS